MSIYKLNQRRIRFKNRSLIKAKEVRIVKMSGITYIEAIPSSYENEISIDKLQELYNSFIDLGRNLYNANKENIEKIIFNSHNCRYVNINRSLLNIANQNESDKLKIIAKWLKLNELKGENLYAHKRTDLNYIILKNGEWNSTNELYKWLTSNYISDINESDLKGEYLVYDNGFLVDLAIFMYLVIYSILNQKAIENSQKEKQDKIHFDDFIVIENMKNNFTLRDYIPYINDIMNMYEKDNIYILNGYDKLVIDKDSDEYKMVKEYENLYGILWYVFKLNVSDLCLKDSNDAILPLNICKDCGVPILSANLRCDECDRKNVRDRKAKSRQKKINNILKIKMLLSEYNYPKPLIDKINKILYTNERDLKCKEVNDTLKEMEIYNLENHKIKASQNN